MATHAAKRHGRITESGKGQQQGQDKQRQRESERQRGREAERATAAVADRSDNGSSRAGRARKRAASRRG